MVSSIIISTANIDSGYDAAHIIEVLINTLVQKNVISEKEANYIKTGWKGFYLQTRSNMIRADWKDIKTSKSLAMPLAKYHRIVSSELPQSRCICDSYSFFVDARNAA
jgi:hypothetical protein